MYFLISENINNLKQLFARKIRINNGRRETFFHRIKLQQQQLPNQHLSQQQHYRLHQQLLQQEQQQP